MNLETIIKDKTLWILFILLGISMMGIALYHQYILDELPCILCIQFRVLVIIFVLISLLGLALKDSKTGLITTSISLLLIFLVMLERSYQLLGTERGFIMGECSMDTGFPAWFAIDKWMPSLFEPLITCGYTPEVAFGITMAEALLVMSAGLTLLALVMLVVSFRTDVKA